MSMRLQDAIAQARTLREAVLAGRAPPPPAAATAAAPAGPEVESAWDALPRHAPDPELLAAHRIVTRTGAEEGAAPFDVIRTKLLSVAHEKGWRRVAVTSPTPGCGKSTVSLNLAFSLARGVGPRTLLCEMDLRRPSLQRLLALPGRPQLSRALEGRAPVDDALVRVADRLAIAANARPAGNPAETFHAPAMETALAALERRYAPGLTLFDLPPMMVGDDVLAFAPRADAMLIVAAAEHTSVAQIDVCEREIARHCEVAGVILNKCHHTGDDYGYGYGYGYGHGADG
ncbi:CpsD/CapB family tyrosine-protein kinase [Jannaschia sp. W003]|uniref:CpsD/CapB family tyrosine-protein kinase n=1 Tax=Jannaschia sp. W003 TaxID=2867012 RepID=UPI0021A51259|nr:CpsD/CapB family tyrosine-protein kinase [Jannaschia sp. W003]UWQ21849.1 CpsD/CapB family tyrosine-protein kinase [Jannaschia sp. W003]